MWGSSLVCTNLSPALDKSPVNTPGYSRALGKLSGQRGNPWALFGHKEQQQKLWVEKSSLPSRHQENCHGTSVISGYLLYWLVPGTCGSVSSHLRLVLEAAKGTVLVWHWTNGHWDCHKMMSWLGVIWWWSVYSLIFCFIPKMVPVAWRWVQGEPWVYQSLTPEASVVLWGFLFG